MNQRFASIRYSYIRSHIYGLFLTCVTILSILLSIYVLFHPNWLSAASIFLFISLYIGLALIISVYAGFKSGGDVKDRFDYLSVQITQFANGNYTTKVYFNEGDEITRIGNEMNELGEKLQNQVRSLQRMADEKSEFAKSAHKAAVIEERQRIARDLHDAVSQQLFALTMLSEAAIKQFDKHPEKAKTQMIEVSKAALQSQAEMRALLLHLRPVYLSGESLSDGISKLINELQQKSNIEFHISIPNQLSVSSTIEEQVFRIVQESLSNILRHANATEVRIDIAKRSNELFMHVRDNGKGFDVLHERKTSYGLKTMKERSEELGGTFSVRSNLQEGTYIDIRIPC
ncbi:MAG: sensor histidine kinase [Bacillota bacterium]|uniref:Sensor histidine kinase n=1 Tax=Virgibacillus salarius TaxID=447199 RepID=A0A941I9T0_9BACI|nr:MULTISPECIES: sensor histidine kinase [Bacillaceae]NAZ09798.1 sensor histidine kinase [Agaribacter marinus]MBR7797089.1 sensor histidine kinase [Virgibacillus salarius]MCC2250850.1 sensor histidine kinase [Virgibacillus sp. AGTR]MDY7044903.1 sensor histidine kinase [Virgibacillus sp. M23]QRZ16474.1 sensor histidine kinase [Virgibacillus sp. AGTR]